MDDAGLPDDIEFRAVMRAYMESAVIDFIAYPDSDTEVPSGAPVPHWSWDGPQPTSAA